MNILVTGGAGFIGSNIVNRLSVLEENNVVIVDDLSSGNVDNLCSAAKKQLNEHSILDDNKMRELFNNYKFDAVFHLAVCKKRIGDLNPATDLLVNSLGTLKLAILCREFGVKKFIYSSTGSVYGNQTQIDVLSPQIPVSYYGVSKLAAENYLRLFTREMTVNAMRYFHVYGKNQNDSEYGGVVARFIKLGKEGKDIPVYGDGDQIRLFTHVDDVVDRNIEMLDVKKSTMTNICAMKPYSINQLADWIADKFNVKVTHHDPIPGDIYNFNVVDGYGRYKIDFFKELEELI